MAIPADITTIRAVHRREQATVALQYRTRNNVAVPLPFEEPAAKSEPKPKKSKKD